MTGLTLSLAAAVGLGLGICLWLAPGPRLRGAEWILAFCAAVPLGLGLASTGFFLWAVLLRLRLALLLGIEVALAFLLLVWAIRAARRVSPGIQGPLQQWSLLDGLLVPVFVLAAGVALHGFLCRSVREPHGLWDAWAIWNLKARFLFRGGEHWREALSPLLSWSHPDYPLLVPGIVARGWTFAGGETTAVPIAVDLLFTFATVGMLTAAVWDLRGRTQGLLAGLMLLGTAFFVAHGASQYAEIPLACFMLVSLIVLLKADHASDGSTGRYALAGLLAGMAAWTKNEGGLFLAVLVVVQAALLTWEGAWTSRWRRLAVFCAGALPMVLLVMGFKILLAPPTDLVA